MCLPYTKVQQANQCNSQYPYVPIKRAVLWWHKKAVTRNEEDKYPLANHTPKDC